MAIFMSMVMVGAVHAAVSGCAAPGKASDLHVAPGDPAAITPTLRMLPWSGDQLEVKSARVVSGECLASVQSFSASAIRLEGNLMVQVGDTGEVSVMTAAPRLPALPSLKPKQGHGDADDQDLTDPTLGEYLTAARIEAVHSATGITQYFLSVWKLKGGAVIAVMARQPDGVISTPIKLLRSQLPVRSVTYQPAPDASGGTIGITQEADGELHLIEVRWTHHDFAR